jgi:hypothetical protein
MSSTGLSFAAARGKARAMDKKPEPVSREERLAAKLRENLKRRKAQARSLEPRSPEQDGNGALPKVPPKS